MAQWTITRLELLYYNRRHKRWQIWQESGTVSPEDALKPGFLHRKQIFSLLGIVHNYLSEVTAGVPNLEVAQVTDANNRSVINFAVGTSTSTLRKKLSEMPAFWVSYLEYVRSTAELYGIPIPIGAEAPANGLARNLGEFLKWDDLEKLTPGSTLNLTRQVALDLISMLPVLRHWDLQGCWYRVLAPHWEGSKGVFSTFTKKWAAPFYMVALKKSGRIKDNGSSSGSLVECPLDAELLWADLEDLDKEQRAFPGETYHCGPRDFFDCCHIPESGDEACLYRAYAYLFDKLRGALDTTGSTDEGNGTKSESPNGQDYFIAYPVPVLGRLNFLQIWVHTDDANAVLKSLWDFWFQYVHANFWHEAHDFLRFHLTSISHVNFQALWQKSMGANTKHGGAELLLSSLCQCAYLLMPFSWIQWSCNGMPTETWGYSRHDCADIPGWDAQEPPTSNSPNYGGLGAIWGKLDPRTDLGAGGPLIEWITEKKSYSIRYKLSLSSALFKASIAHGAVRLVIEQQLSLGEMFFAQKKEELEDRIDWIVQAILGYFSNPVHVAAYQRDKEVLNRDLIEVPEKHSVLGVRASVQALLNELELEKREAILRTWAIPSLTVTASLYLEIGPVKHLTHHGKNLWDESCSLAEAIRKLRDISGLPFLGSRSFFWTNVLSWIYPSRVSLALNKWRKNVLRVQAACSRCALQIESLGYRDNIRFDDVNPESPVESTAYDNARCEFYADSLRYFVPALEIEPVVGQFRFRPCLPVLDLFLGDILQAIFLLGVKSTHIAINAFAVPLSSIPIQEHPGSAAQKPEIFSNLFCIRYPLEGLHPSRDRFTNASWIGDLRHKGLTHYARLLVGFKSKGIGSVFLDITEDNKEVDVGDYISRLVDEPEADKEAFDLNEHDYLIALECTTVRSRK